jgi:DNA polymerase III epsilon subunit-like protein
MTLPTTEEKVRDRDQAIKDARFILNNKYFILDTETTGLETFAEICQIAIISSDGNKYKSLIKPTVHIGERATEIHHIVDEDVKDAPNITEIIRNIPVFGIFVAYNTPFDMRILKQSLLAYGHIYNEEDNFKVCDAMQIYSAFKGEWDEYHGNYRWHKLEEACKQCGIEIDLELHDAMSDAIMTERLLKYVASQKTSEEE